MVGGRYKDDPLSEKFEIAVADDGSQYLAFELSVVERAHAYDEAILFESVEIGLRLMPDGLDSFTEGGSLI